MLLDVRQAPDDLIELVRSLVFYNVFDLNARHPFANASVGCKNCT